MDDLEILRHAILGSEPPFSIIHELEQKGLGTWQGGHLDRWTWNRRVIGSLPEPTCRRILEMIAAAERGG